MSLTALAIEKNRVTWVALAVVVAAGVFTYRGLPRAEDPGFVVRTAVVLTYFPGASPDRVESLVTDPLEKVIQEMPQVDFLASQSKTGVSQINVNVKTDYKEMRPIWDELRRKVDGAVRSLPEGVRGPFVNDEFGEVFGVVLAITGDGLSPTELEEVADEVRDELLLIEEVAKVDRFGVQDQRIFVEYENSRLAELGMSPIQLQSILESQNIIIPGGEVVASGERIALEPSGNFESLEELRAALVQLPARPELIALGDLAEIRRGTVDPPRTLVRAADDPELGSLPAIVLAVSLRGGGNVLTLGEKVEESIARLRSVYPVGIELAIVQFQPDAVAQKVSDFMGSLVQAVLIVLVVMLFSLGVRTGLVVASLIPMAIVSAILFFPLAGVGIDQMSLAALIIALGMLVDNAIVMSESIMVQMAAGKSALQSAIDSAAELRIPLLTSSLTTAAAFLPIYLAESNIGEYTAPLFKVVTITLLCSWVLSLTMVPMLCVRFLRPAKEEQSFDTPFYRRYRAFVTRLVRHPWIALAVVFGLFAFSVFLFRFVPVQFMPPNDRATFTVELRLPAGTDIAVTDGVVAEVERHLEEELAVTAEEAAAGEQGVLSWASFVGQGAPRFVLPYNPEQASPDYAILLLNASSRPAVDVLIAEIADFCADRFPDVVAKAAPLQNGPAIAYPIEVRISARDRDELFARVETVKGHLREMPGSRNVGDDWGARSKKLRVEVDPARAQRAGVSNQDVAVSLQTLLSGFTTTQFREGDEAIPVVMRSVATDREDFDSLASLNVFAQATGRSVPLAQVADLELEWQSPNVRRRDRLPTVTVQADLAPGMTASELNAELVPWLEEESAGWALGAGWELGGEQETSQKSNQSISEKLPVAGLIIVLLLVAQFNSIRRPLIILITIPLGVIGVVAGLLIMRSYFGFMTLLGLISLAGVVINNAIVLLDRIRLEIEENELDPANAIVASAQQRLRPILLTTFTTLGGLIPLYLGGGPMWEPMAVAIMFGLVFATGLTLGVVPVLYRLLFRVDVGSLGVGRST